MAPEEQKKDESGKGFAGLSSMVSNVDAAIKTAGTRKSEPSPTAASTGRNVPEPQPAEEAKPTPGPYQQPSRPSSRDPSVGKWLLFISCAFIGLLLLAESGKKSTAPAPTPYSSPPTTVNPPPSTNRSEEVPAKPSSASRLAEEKPPVGTNLKFEIAQIRYCLAEDIRIEGARGALNNEIESDVDRFNAMVNDYNSRCSKFRYRRGVLESARSEVERYRAVLESEGRSRFTRNTSSGSKNVPPESVGPQPDEIVRAIQRRLNKLGYDAGAPDGFFGPKTRGAISAFQRDHGMLVDGLTSESLLSLLNKTSSTSDAKSTRPQ